MSLHTPACDLFGVRYPIVQTGMGWVAGSRLVAATAEAGALGILAAATMSHDQLERQIAEVKEKTDKPFGVNLRGDQEDIGSRIQLLIRQQVRVASFARAPGPEIITRLKEAGIVTMPTIGAPRHAEKVVQMGVDALIAQGAEGGGHTGDIATTLLVPDVCGKVKVPVLAAGGFMDGRGLVAALAFGAAGIAMGTRFLLTKESTVPEAVKLQYLQTKLDGTVVTKAVDGYPQRVVRTALIDRLERAGTLGGLWSAMRHVLALRDVTGATIPGLIREGLAMRRHEGLGWAQIAMAGNAPMLTRATLVDGRLDAGVLPTGQVVGRIRELPTVAEVVASIVAEAEATLSRLSAINAGGSDA